MALFKIRHLKMLDRLYTSDITCSEPPPPEVEAAEDANPNHEWQTLQDLMSRKLVTKRFNTYTVTKKGIGIVEDYLTSMNKACGTENINSPRRIPKVIFTGQ